MPVPAVADRPGGALSRHPSPRCSVVGRGVRAPIGLGLDSGERREGEPFRRLWHLSCAGANGCIAERQWRTWRDPMSSNSSQATGPDLAHGIAAADLADGSMLAGHVAGEPVLLARRGAELFAIGAQCTHYGGP